MNRECGCEHGENCTKTTVCAIESACEDLKLEVENLQDTLNQIEVWCKAYPIKSFPEPDWKYCDTILKDHDQSLSRISASNMRHVVDGIQRIIGATAGDRQ